MSHWGPEATYAMEIGTKNRLVTHNLVHKSKLLFSYMEDRQHAFIEYLRGPRDQILIRVRSNLFESEALLCANRHENLRLRRSTTKFRRSRECRWAKKRVIKTFKRDRYKRRRRRRRKRHGFEENKVYRLESKYGSYLSVSKDGNVTLSREMSKNNEFRLRLSDGT